MGMGPGNMRPPLMGMVPMAARPPGQSEWEPSHDPSYDPSYGHTLTLTLAHKRGMREIGWGGLRDGGSVGKES